jgi:ATP-dependent helicase/nuclease subunit B
MGVVAVTSAANHDRILFGQEWLKTKTPAEEVLIIGSTLAGANEIARSLIREKRAAFGYHRLSWGQFAATLARPLSTVQRTVPLGGLGVQAVANRAIDKLSQVGGLGRYAGLTSGPGFARAIAKVTTELRLEQIKPDALAHVALDLCPLLQAYEQELADHGFTDWPGVLQIAAAAVIESGFRHQLLGLPTLLLVL